MRVEYDTRVARDLLSLDGLWNSTPVDGELIDRERLSLLPAAARKYLGHAIAPGARSACAVRLQMHGQIKLKGWLPFSAEEVIRWDRGMIWRAVVRMHGVQIRGGDTFLDGEGAMRWKLFGFLPMVNASGTDVTRSAAGRVNIESIWLPSALCTEHVSWTSTSDFQCHASFTAHNEPAEVDYGIDQDGRLKTVSMPRWGNPGGAEFHYANCGGFVEAEGQFGGYTIPTRMRVGWHFGTERFESEGEFFRVIIDDAAYR